MLEPSWTYLSEIVRRVYPDIGELDPQPMTGGASTRRFFRIALGPKAGREGARRHVRPRRAHARDPQGPRLARWPFLEVRDFSPSGGIRVPEILADGTEQGWLVVEDLGDDTVANYLLKHPGAKRASTGRRSAISARAAELASLPETSIVKSRAFDHDLLRREIDHFMEWASPPATSPSRRADKIAFDGSPIASPTAHRGLAAWLRPSRLPEPQFDGAPENDGSADASSRGSTSKMRCSGPRVYDLVALLSDSYQEFDADFIEERLDEYAEHCGARRHERAEFCCAGVRFRHRAAQAEGRRAVHLHRRRTETRTFLALRRAHHRKARAAIERLSDDADMRALGGAARPRSRRPCTLEEPGEARARRHRRRRQARPALRGQRPLLAARSERLAGLPRVETKRSASGSIDTYVPWGVHETAPGAARLRRARRRARRGGFLRLVHELGLYAIVRPGPHINAELTYFGIPERMVWDPACQARSPQTTR